MIFCGVSPSTRSALEPSKTARPPITSTPRRRATPASPRASLAMTRSSFQARSASIDIFGSPYSTPISLARSTSCITLGDVQQRLRRDAPLEEAGAAQALARVHHDGVEAQLGRAKGRRVAAGSAAHHHHVHLAHEIAHHHGCRTSELQQELVGVLEQPHEIRGQAGAIGAVGHAVVEGERERQDEPRDDASRRGPRPPPARAPRRGWPLPGS